MKTAHSDLTSTSAGVGINGYLLSGMCQYDGSLDFFVGYHLSTKELRVCDLLYNSTSLNYTTQYCKPVPYNLEIETSHIYADCQYTGRSKEYIIAIGASAYDVSNPGQFNYLFAKFNTKFNFTETLVESHDSAVSERLTDVKVDLTNDLIYVILQINSNEYLGAKVYEAEDDQTENNPNVAILAYYISRTSNPSSGINPDANGLTKWVTLFGDITYADYYVGLENNILVLNSYTDQVLDSSLSNGGAVQKDIYLYKFRPETGYIEQKLHIGSPTDDEAISVTGHLGSTYILAKVNNEFLPHPTTGSIWGMDSNDTYLGLIWINSKFELVDIEGYAVSTMDTLPMLAIPSIPDVYETQFMLFSPASKLEVNGLLITQFDNATLLYATTDCNLTCLYCDRYTKQNDCLYCDEFKTQFLYKGECLSACEQRTYEHTHPVSETAQKHCLDCHYSCKNCLGPRNDQCLTCCSNGD